LRFSKLAAVLFLSALILGTPYRSFGAEDVDVGDNIAVAAVETDNASSSIEVPAAETDNVVESAQWADNTIEPAPGIDNAVELAPEISSLEEDTLPADDTALTSPSSDNAMSSPEDDEDYDFREPDFGEKPVPHLTVADPIEPINRAFFVFNDKFYYWVAKPVAEGYNYVVNEDIRVSVRNFFSNIGTPIRATNNLLQGNFLATGTELLRFVMNSTMGILGFFDVARDFGIEKTNADLGQTLGKYGIGNGMYFVMPVFGPSTLRDGVGAIGDLFLDPLFYMKPWDAAIAVRTYRTGNDASLQIGLYEEMTGAAIDPYIAVKDAYIQNRFKAVRGRPASE